MPNEKNNNNIPPIFLHQHHKDIFKHGLTYSPWYDDRTDFNTSAKSYYDALGRELSSNNVIIDIINRLFARNVLVKDSVTIDFTKIGDWFADECGNYDNEITITAEVILSKLIKEILLPSLSNTPFKLNNSITKESDGIFSPDFTNILQAIDNKITEIMNIITEIIDSIGGGGNEHTIEIPRHIDITNNNVLLNQVDLGEVDDTTRVELEWIMGSTIGTQICTVGDLKGRNAHVMSSNMTDYAHELDFQETWTHIINNNKLWTTAIHKGHMRDDGKFLWTVAPYDENNKAYYDSQDPKLKSDPSISSVTFRKLIVYDKIKIGVL